MTRDAWHAALARGAARTRRSPCGPTTLAEPDYALVWKPPPELFARVRPTRAIFNLGAGVDALLGDARRCRDDVPVIRLEDAGMAEQMAEYVTLAVLARVPRVATSTRAQQREGRWQPRPRLRQVAIRRRHPGLRRARAGGRRARSRRSASRFAAGARRARAFRASQSFAGAAELAAFLAASRVLVCLLPSTPATRGSPRPREPRRSCRAARIVVNVARGRHRRRRGSGRAARRRPPRRRHARRVSRRAAARRVIRSGIIREITLTPHTSAVTVVDDSVAQIAGKIRRLERGEPVTGVVDRARGY